MWHIYSYSVLRCSVLQCVAVCCSVLWCVAVCCSVLQCVAGCCSELQCVAVCVLLQKLPRSMFGPRFCRCTSKYIHVGWSITQKEKGCVLHCSVLQCDAVCCRCTWRYIHFGCSITRQCSDSSSVLCVLPTPPRLRSPCDCGACSFTLTTSPLARVISPAYTQEACPIWMSHVPYERVMSHMNESFSIWTSHAPYERVMSHMNESCLTWMS